MSAPPPPPYFPGLTVVPVRACPPVGGDPAGRGDSVCPAEGRVARGPPPPEEAQAGAHPLHDRVVHVCLLPNAALGLRAAGLGHVPLRG